ncbi:hypothetical protein GX50_03658 [[Emmonsia] crescens]|uniref:Protein kinase domain-containing protein n=1 Tax=[Emmonsia] crescens TaxID=73230 RepID=A0A2B7ZKH9_9EURO|nr:hypothetical protein GX50_03658 [Emmonsia crescens]
MRALLSKEWSTKLDIRTNTILLEPFSSREAPYSSGPKTQNQFGEDNDYSNSLREVEDCLTCNVRGPEAHLQIGWGTRTDIWSFGALLVALIYGDNFFIFKPRVPFDHEDYQMEILIRQCQFFGPFPASYQEIAGPETLAILIKAEAFLENIRKEVSEDDRDFILKIMKLDPRDRPNAQEPLDNE